MASGGCDSVLALESAITNPNKTLLKLPILDDPVVLLTMLNPGFHLRVAGYITTYWVISIFTLFVGFYILLSTAPCLSKTERNDPRLTPLKDPPNLEELIIESDAVYDTLKKVNDAFTFRIASPLSMILC